jgi:hypothetical protein
VSYWGNAGPPKNIVIQNNFFDEGGDGGYYSLRFSNFPPAWENVLIRNNSAVEPLNIDPGPRKINFRVIANVAPMPSWECVSRVTYRYNVWKGARCGRTDLNAVSGFRDPSVLDLRLKAGSPAINRGDPKSFPRTDIQRQRRPMGRRPDAGADELR